MRVWGLLGGDPYAGKTLQSYHTMKNSGLRRIWVLLAVAAGLMAQDLRAEFIQPVAVWVFNGEETQDALINGQGFEDPGVGTPDSKHVTADGEMWTAIGATKGEVVLDLGQTVSLVKVYIWNYSGTETDRGMKDVQVLVSPDTDMTNATFTGIAVVSLKEGGASAQVFDVKGTDVRLVKLKGASNWGHGWAIGLAEVRFESGTITGHVPSVAIQGLKDGDVVPFGSPLAITAKVADKDNNLAKVEFFDGTAKLGEVTKAPYSLSVSNLALGYHTFQATATDITSLVGWSMVNVMVKEVIPGTIIQVDDAADEGTSTNQISYTGTWTLAQGNANDPRFKNNDHYSSTKNSYFEVRFVGAKIDVYATVASHHGTGNATIDGGTVYPIIYKAAQRAEQVLVWSSPMLPNREHVLRVTVAGDGVVTADRFDVLQTGAPAEDEAMLRKWTATLTSLVLEMEDVGKSVVNVDSLKLAVDGTSVKISTSKTGTNTTITYLPSIPFVPGTTHAFNLTAKDTSGADVSAQDSFSAPKPVFPLAGLGEPRGAAGAWGFRQIWGAGRADALVTAVDIALAANKPGFTNNVYDTTVPTINLALSSSPGASGFFPDEQPFPAEAQGLTASDFVTVARAKVKIPSTGDWTFAVHSDEGFALRLVGAPFSSVSGEGEIDEQFPEYLLDPNNTADSNTRGVVSNLVAGEYVMEFITWQRAGGSSVEVYAAPGAWAEDVDTSDWALIGAAGGLELVTDEPLGPDLAIQRLIKSGNNLVIEFVTPKPAGTHQVQESTDFKSWTVAAANISPIAGFSQRAALNNLTGPTRFYRIALLSP
jgi:hypothetical protein